MTRQVDDRTVTADRGPRTAGAGLRPEVGYMQMPVMEPAHRWALIRAYHVHDVPPRVAQVAALWGLGIANHDVASVLGIEAATVERHGERARDLLVPAELDATRATVQCWAQVHSPCCIATQWAHFTAG